MSDRIDGGDGMTDQAQHKTTLADVQADQGCAVGGPCCEACYCAAAVGALPGAELAALLRDLYTPEEVVAWWRSPQPMFDGALPLDLIAAGREVDLVLSLRRIVEGVYV